MAPSHPKRGKAGPIVGEYEPGIYGGVDTHLETHVAAVVDSTGRIVGVESFRTNGAGYRALATWMGRHGPLVRVGIEGTGAYGAGLARHLADAGVEVVEVSRPNRQTRRRRGKSDTVDAEAAARAALNGEAGAERYAHLRSYLSTTRKPRHPRHRTHSPVSSTTTPGCHLRQRPPEHLRFKRVPFRRRSTCAMRLGRW